MKKLALYLSLGVLAAVFIIACSSDEKAAVENPVGSTASPAAGSSPNAESGNGGLVGILASGDGDEISVDNDSVCENPGSPESSDPGDREDNSLCPNSAFVIWVHEADQSFDSTYRYRICNNGSKKNCTAFQTLCAFSSCGGEWRAYTTADTTGSDCTTGVVTLTTPNALGSRTAQVVNGSGVKIGSDSFLLTNDCNQTND